MFRPIFRASMLWRSTCPALFRRPWRQLHPVSLQARWPAPVGTYLRAAALAALAAPGQHRQVKAAKVAPAAEQPAAEQPAAAREPAREAAALEAAARGA